MTQTLYLIGADRSGSTLLGRLLAAQSAICDVGELYRLNSPELEALGCACGRPPRDCPFWSGVIETLENRGLPIGDIDLTGDEAQYFPRRLLAPAPIVQMLAVSLTGAPPRLSVPRVKKMVEAACNCSVVTDIAAEKTGARVVFDSSKIAAYGLARYLTRPASTKIVHLVRDGRAASASMMRHLGAPMSDVARRWRRTTLAALAVNARVSRARRTRLRYEALCENPGAEVERLCSFVCLPYERSGLLPAAGHALGGSRSPMLREKDIRVDDRWRSELNARDRETFEREAGWLNRRLGYSSD